MKYRIRAITYKNGRKAYFPEKKVTFGWKGINWRGELVPFESEFEIKIDALAAIDKHCEGNNTVQTIEFHYINK